jgi:predicted flap endonuclease-1-like 5' DNA nuclease
MKQTSADYTFGIASVEIILLLLGAFLLGMLLCWLLRKMGICCKTHSVNTEHRPSSTTTSVPSSAPANTREGGRTPREFPGADLKAGGYTADINSLLRNREPTPPPVPTAATRTASVDVSTGAETTAASGFSLAGIASGHKDDLKKLEGIGPKLEQVLNAVGIQNFEQLAGMTAEQIKPILDAAGNQFRMHDPKSWPYQAELAQKGEWERLKEYQNLLISGHD